MAAARAAKLDAAKRARLAAGGPRVRLRGKRPAGEALAAPGLGDDRPGPTLRAPLVAGVSADLVVAAAPTPARKRGHDRLDDPPPAAGDGTAMAGSAGGKPKRCRIRAKSPCGSGGHGGPAPPWAVGPLSVRQRQDEAAAGRPPTSPPGGASGRCSAAAGSTAASKRALWA
eukprot:15476063-Alexandrium_andersonii.AAC.1